MFHLLRCVVNAVSSFFKSCLPKKKKTNIDKIRQARKEGAKESNRFAFWMTPERKLHKLVKSKNVVLGEEHNKCFDVYQRYGYGLSKNKIGTWHYLPNIFTSNEGYRYNVNFKNMLDDSKVFYPCPNFERISLG